MVGADDNGCGKKRKLEETRVEQSNKLIKFTIDESEDEDMSYAEMEKRDASHQNYVWLKLLSSKESENESSDMEM